MRQRGNTLLLAISLSGVLVLASGTLLGVLFYNHHNSFAFSLANHFVSELGWAKTSTKAWVFNWALIIGGLMIFPMIVALGRHINRKFSAIAITIGLCASVSGACVGIFPMDNLKPHLYAAIVYWITNTFVVLLFTLAVASRKAASSRFMLVTGISCCLFNLAFISIPKHSLTSAIRKGALLHPELFQRPLIWWPAFLEWAAYIAFLLWLCSVIFFLWHGESDQIERRTFR